jgi:hypothetical protein
MITIPGIRGINIIKIMIKFMRIEEKRSKMRRNLDSLKMHGMLLIITKDNVL